LILGCFIGNDPQTFTRRDIEFKAHLKEVIKETLEEMGVATKEDIKTLLEDMKK